MWRPGFDYAERRIAIIRGYHRSLCVYSHVHRGTTERPGLVLGLDRGGSCKGVAFRVPAAQKDATVCYLREREQVTLVYREISLRARLEDGRQVTTLSYAADRDHCQYAGRLDPAELKRLVAQGIGMSGENSAYVLNTHKHLQELGIHDEKLDWLAREFMAAQGQAGEEGDSL
jgi:cation transport protein ChaC